MDKKNKLAFTRTNYILMLIGISTIVMGFVIMALDRQPHGFGFLGITLGPIVVMVGFVIEFFAIMVKSKTENR